MASNNPGRAYSTNYNDHSGLLRKLALRGWGRLTAANVHMDLEEVYQEMCVAFCKAAEKYDAERGITFTAYLGRAVWNEFNKFANRAITEQVELNLTSFECMSASNDDEELDIFEAIDSGEWTPEQYLSAAQQFRENMKALGPTAKFIIGKLLNPDDELLAALEAKRVAAEEERAKGKVASGRREVSIKLIAEHYNLKEESVRAARKSFASIIAAAA